MTCHIPVQISEHWTIAIAVRCEDSEQIYVLSEIVVKDHKKPSFEITVASVEEAGDNIVYVKVLPWSADGNYQFDGPPGRPLCSSDPLALAVKVAGQVLLMTQHGDDCKTTFEPAMTGSNARTQRWVFSTDGTKPKPICYSWEYTLLGGKNSNEAQVLQCTDFFAEGAAGQNSSFHASSANVQLGDAGGQTNSDRHTAQQKRLHETYGNRLGREPGAAQADALSVGGQAWTCSYIESCPPRISPNALVYLVSAATRGTFESCVSASDVPKFYVTPVPFNMFTTCKGKNMRLNIKDAIALYRQPYIFQQGCKQEQPLSPHDDDRSGEKVYDCLFIALDDCSGYQPRNCGSQA